MLLSIGYRRFLRARKWSVQDAYGQFKDTEEWRQANQLEVLYDTVDVEAYEQTRGLVRRSGSLALEDSG